MTTAPLTDVDPTSGGSGRIWSRFLRRPLGVVALVVFLGVVAVALLAPWLAPYDPNLVDFSLAKAPPGDGHLLGGDSAGRDLYSRLLFGARTTLYGAVVACLSGLVLGAPAGIASGYVGGILDRVSCWISDAVQSVPGMVVLLIVAAGTGSNFTILMVTLGFFLSPGFFRISRARTLVVRREPYIDAAQVAGLATWRIMGTHLMRAVYAPIIIQTALTAGIALALQAGLQFLGVGGSSTPSWGAMMNDGFNNMLTHPLILLWPSVALGVTMAALAFMGSTLADLVTVRTPSFRRRRRRRFLSRVEVDAPIEPVRSTPEPERRRRAEEDGVLRVENLSVSYPTSGGSTEVVHGVSLDVAPGEVLGIVGESGSGKSQTVFAALDLLPRGGRVQADGVWINGQEIRTLTGSGRHGLLGSTVGYVPQEPMTNLDSCYTIGHQLVEPLRVVLGLSRAAARLRARTVLEQVGISDVDRVLASYPHQISGGMAQRVLIAGAVACKPALVVADEPTTALDVMVQAEVLELLRDLQEEYGMALVIVTHNFGVVADICDRVAVMKDGRMIETGPVQQIFTNPTCEYTADLIRASLDDTEGRRRIDAAEELTTKSVRA